MDIEKQNTKNPKDNKMKEIMMNINKSKPVPNL